MLPRSWWLLSKIICDYSRVAAPLTQLTTTNFVFTWTPWAETTFPQTQATLGDSPILYQHWLHHWTALSPPVLFTKLPNAFENVELLVQCVFNIVGPSSTLRCDRPSASCWNQGPDSLQEVIPSSKDKQSKQTRTWTLLSTTLPFVNPSSLPAGAEGAALFPQITSPGGLT